MGRPELAAVGARVAVGTATPPPRDLDESPPIAHRGPAHSLVFCLLVGVGTGTIAAGARAVLAADPPTLAGTVRGAALVTKLGHLGADPLTPMRGRPLWPVTRWHVTLDVFASKHRFANLARLAVGAIACGAVGILPGSGPECNPLSIRGEYYRMA